MNISINKLVAFFAKSKDVHPIISRVVVSFSLWGIDGEIFTFAKMYSLPLALEVDWKAPLLLLGGAMVVVFAITCVKRKTLDKKSIKSCDETIDFVMDEVSSSVLNIGGICVALTVNAGNDGAANIGFMGVSAGCYALFVLLEKKNKKVIENPSQAELHDMQ